MRIPAHDTRGGVVIVWEFLVRPNKRRAFERIYGPRGDWARLFGSGSGYIRTDMVRDLDARDKYLTLDYWRSRRDYKNFQRKNREAYRVLDDKCETLTSKEAKIGEFGIKA
ncbi:MAG TPA: antibiotic biosynthesis monooxygenase [Terriglobales bacterium]|nr:antibiotic biosynthesis monooxygenase [Terriglobales bacterium]